MSTDIYKESNLSLTIDDRVFLGEGLFETLQVINSKPCYPQQHWQRLNDAAHFLSIPFEISLELWLEKLKQLIRLKNLQDGGIKVILAAGKASRGLEPKTQESYLIFNAFHYIKSIEPLKLITAPWQRDANNPIYQYKTINYLEAIIARRSARARGADEVLFFNFQNHATDTSIANLFIIKNNSLFTPSLSSGLLPGIIRQRLLVLCKEQGIDCKEIELDKNNLMQADAAFTSNALQGLRSILSWDNHSFNTNHELLSLLQQSLLNDQHCFC